MNVFKRIIFLWLPVFAYAAAIFLVSSLNKATINAYLAEGTTKYAHFVVYAGFGWVTQRAFYQSLNGSPLTIWLVVLTGFTYALSDELHQSFVPSRQGSFGDVLIDLGGFLLAVMVVIFFRKRWRWG